MKKSTKVTLGVIVLGCVIGIGAGRLITGQPLFSIPENTENTAEQGEDDGKSGITINGIALEDIETIYDDDNAEQLKAVQEEMNETTAEYIKQQEANREATLKAEEEAKKAEEAKKKSEEEAKKAEETAKNEVPGESASNSGDNDTTSTPENGSGDVIEGLDDDYYDDYTEDQNVETAPSDSNIKIDPSLLGDNVMFTNDMDFGDPSQHQSDWDSFEPTVDMSGWNGTFH